jgi:nucleotide-binding universal stress UspA family protein
MIATIMVAVDDSQAAFRAAELAIELAGRLDARLVAVSVLDELDAGTRTPIHPRPGESADLRAAQRHVRDAAAGTGVAVELCTVHGHVADALLDEARRVGAELMVIGRVDRPGVQITRVGRTAEQVLEFSEIPVLVVPAGR